MQLKGVFDGQKSYLLQMWAKQLGQSRVFFLSRPSKRLFLVVFDHVGAFLAEGKFWDMISCFLGVLLQIGRSTGRPTSGF